MVQFNLIHHITIRFTFPASYSVGLQAEAVDGDNAGIMLESIRDDIRQKLPLDAMTETENVLQPKFGKVHVGETCNSTFFYQLYQICHS